MKLATVFIICLIHFNTYAKDRFKIEKSVIHDMPDFLDVTAFYLDITNLTNDNIQIKNITCENIKKVEFHETLKKDGMMKMVEIEKLIIPKKGKISFIPGAKHFMAYGVKHPIADKTKCTLDNKEIFELKKYSEK